MISCLSEQHVTVQGRTDRHEIVRKEEVTFLSGAACRGLEKIYTLNFLVSSTYLFITWSPLPSELPLLPTSINPIIAFLWAPQMCQMPFLSNFGPCSICT